MLIPISQIAVIKRQRKKMDPKKLQELAASIKRAGKLIHPIVVRATQPDEIGDSGLGITEPWVLIAGGRRTAAHVMLGLTEIEANDFGQLDALEQQIIELEENLNRENLTWQEEVSAKERIHNLRVAQNPSHTLADTAKELGEDTGNLSKDLKLVRQIKADPSLRDASSKRGAIRKADHRAHIAQKVANVKAADIGELAGRIVTADMRDYLRGLPDQSVDLLFSDLPFGVGYDSIHFGESDHKGAYDDSEANVKDILADAIPHMVRVLKPDGWLCLFMGYDNLEWLRRQIHDACGAHAEYRIEGTKLCRGAARPTTRGEVNLAVETCRFLMPETLPWVWYRPNSRQYGHWPELHAKHEYDMIQVVNGGSAKLVLRSPPDVLVCDVEYKDRDHEMQKPIELCKQLIARFCVTGDRVIDVCYGSGTSLAAAAALGMNYGGCDLNPDNRGPAIARVAEHQRK